VRLGGHAGFVAGLVTVSTMLGIVSVPVTLALFHAMQPR
jgi:malonate transporter